MLSAASHASEPAMSKTSVLRARSPDSSAKVPLNGPSPAHWSMIFWTSLAISLLRIVIRPLYCESRLLETLFTMVSGATRDLLWG